MRKTTLAVALAIGLLVPAYAQEGNSDKGSDFPSFHHHHHHGWQSGSGCHSEESGWSSQENGESVYGATDGDSERHRRRRRRRRHHDHHQFGAAGGWGHRGFGGPEGVQGQLDPQRESETVGFLSTNYPEKARELERLKAASPEYYGQALFMMSHRVRFLQMMQERNPEQFKAMLEGMIQRDRLMAQNHGPADSAAPSTVRSRLHNAVDQVCDMAEPVPPSAAAGSFVAIAAGLGAWLLYRRRRHSGLDNAGMPTTEV